MNRGTDFESISPYFLGIFFNDFSHIREIPSSIFLFDRDFWIAFLFRFIWKFVKHDITWWFYE